MLTATWSSRRGASSTPATRATIEPSWEATSATSSPAWPRRPPGPVVERITPGMRWAASSTARAAAGIRSMARAGTWEAASTAADPPGSRAAADSARAAASWTRSPAARSTSAWWEISTIRAAATWAAERSATWM